MPGVCLIISVDVMSFQDDRSRMPKTELLLAKLGINARLLGCLWKWRPVLSDAFIGIKPNLVVLRESP